MKTIIINATAIVSSGSLTILKDFIAYILQLEAQSYHFILFTGTKSVFITQKHLKVFEIEKQNWRARIAWDKKNLQKFCEKEKIIPDIVISFQNTCSKFTRVYKNTKQIVYFHNVLPIENYSWNPFKKQERILFLYRYIYGFFVNRWNNNVEYIVQLQNVKDKFCNKFKNIKKERVHVIRPNLPKIDIENIEQKELFKEKKIFIYPATPFEYKNHKVIIEAVKLLKINNKLANNLSIIFTVPKDSKVAYEITKNRLEDIIKCTGSVPYDELLTYYKRCNGLLFPSKIESFGIPLIEAAIFGLPIIASDLPYSHDVLSEYEGAYFADINSPKQWKKQIENIINNSPLLYKPLENNSQNSWELLKQLF